MKSLEILADCIDGDEVTEWGVYDEDGEFYASFASYAEAEQFIIEG